MNLRTSTLLLAGCCLFSAGCHREAAIPSGDFRMTVERIVTDRDEVVSLLQIHVPHNAYISVDNEYSHCMVNLANSPADVARDGEVVLTASRITWQGDDFAYIQTFIGANANGGSTFAGGP